MTLEDICKLAEQYSIARIELHPDGSPKEVEFAPQLQFTGGAEAESSGDELTDYERTLQRMAEPRKGRAA